MTPLKFFIYSMLYTMFFCQASLMFNQIWFNHYVLAVSHLMLMLTIVYVKFIINDKEREWDKLDRWFVERRDIEDVRSATKK